MGEWEVIMSTELIHDRGRGPELVGTRITVQDLFPCLLNSTATEAYVCQLYELSPEQVAAARAYVLNHPDTILAQHLRVETRMAKGNLPEVIEQAERLHATFLQFKEWAARRRQEVEAWQTSGEIESESDRTGATRIRSFREWVAQQDASVGQGSCHARTSGRCERAGPFGVPAPVVPGARPLASAGRSGSHIRHTPGLTVTY